MTDENEVGQKARRYAEEMVAEEPPLRKDDKVRVPRPPVSGQHRIQAMLDESEGDRVDED